MATLKKVAAPSAADHVTTSSAEEARTGRDVAARRLTAVIGKAGPDRLSNRRHYA